MNALLALLVLSAPPAQPARVDTTGHALATLQRGLEDALAAVNACRKPAPSPPAPRPEGWHEGKKPPKVASTTPSSTRATLAVDQSGVVASVSLEGASPFVESCLKTALLKLEFGPAPRGAVRTTVVTAELRCNAETCWWSWLPAPTAP